MADEARKCARLWEHALYTNLGFATLPDRNFSKDSQRRQFNAERNVARKWLLELDLFFGRVLTTNTFALTNT